MLLANLMNRSSPEAFFGIVISVGGAFLVAIVAIIVGSWSQVRRREMDTSLKQECLPAVCRPKKLNACFRQAARRRNFASGGATIGRSNLGSRN